MGRRTFFVKELWPLISKVYKVCKWNYVMTLKNMYNCAAFSGGILERKEISTSWIFSIYPSFRGDQNAHNFMLALIDLSVCLSICLHTHTHRVIYIIANSAQTPSNLQWKLKFPWYNIANIMFMVISKKKKEKNQ